MPRLIQYFLSILLIVAGTSKIMNLSDFVQALRSMHWIPLWGAAWLGLIIPSLELSLGFTGMIRPKSTRVTQALIALYGVFLAYNILRLVLGVTGDCGCVMSQNSWLEKLFSGGAWTASLRSLTLFGMSVVLGFSLRAPRIKA